MYNDALVTEEDLNNLPNDIRDDRLMEGVSDFLLSEPFLSCVLGDYRDRLSAALDAAGVTGKHRENIDAVMIRTLGVHIFLLQRATRRLLADFLPDLAETSNGTGHDKDGAK